MRFVHRNAFLKLGLLGATLIALALLSNHTAGAQATAKSGTSAKTHAQEVADLATQAQQNGTVKVIVSLNSAAFDAASAAGAASVSDKSLSDTDKRAASKATGVAQLAASTQARSGLQSALASYNAKVYAGSDWYFPSVALIVDPAALSFLESSPLVKDVSPDHLSKLADNSSTTQIGAQLMWNSAPVSGGYAGQGRVVAILDTGVQDTHPFLSSNGSTPRVIAALAGCFSGDGVSSANPYYSNCPGSTLTTNVFSATGSAIDGEPCYRYPNYSGCEHGTHVAGIAAGGYTGGSTGEFGVAWGANIMPVQIFTCYWTGSTCAEGAYDVDIIGALNWVHDRWLNTSYDITSVNMSIGNGVDYTSNCDSADSTLTTAINTLRNSDGIATVIAAGNNSFTDGISFPACISSSISVGATDFGDNYASFSNTGPQTTILAPGVNVYSSIPTSTYEYLSGTSMATPQVTGAIALLQQEAGPTSIFNNLSVSQLIAIMRNTGRVFYNGSNGYYQYRLNVDQAGMVAVNRQSTIGVYRSNQFLLRNTNTTGFANQVISFGFGTDAYPIVGDWPGSAWFSEIGVYNRNTGTFTLCDDGSLSSNGACNGTPAGEIIHFTLGNPNDIPLSGRWYPHPYSYATSTIDGNTVVHISTWSPTGAGVFRPSNGVLYLKDYLTNGFADYAMVLGLPGDDGIAGDWNMDGQGSPGVYRPSNANWFLSNQVTNGAVFADVNFTYGSPGAAGDLPVVGNWQTTDTTTFGPGVYRTSTGFYFVRNTLNTGFANNQFFYGLSSDLPVVGDWTYHYAEPKPPIGLPSRLPPTILVPQNPQPPNPSNGIVPGGNQIGS